jgi:hypothetical protein
MTITSSRCAVDNRHPTCGCPARIPTPVHGDATHTRRAHARCAWGDAWVGAWGDAWGDARGDAWGEAWATRGGMRGRCRGAMCGGHNCVSAIHTGVPQVGSYALPRLPGRERGGLLVCLANRVLRKRGWVWCCPARVGQNQLDLLCGWDKAWLGLGLRAGRTDCLWRLKTDLLPSENSSSRTASSGSALTPTSVAMPPLVGQSLPGLLCGLAKWLRVGTWSLVAWPLVQHGGIATCGWAKRLRGRLGELLVARPGLRGRVDGVLLLGLNGRRVAQTERP